jgi:hypothetical protein
MVGQYPHPLPKSIADTVPIVVLMIKPLFINYFFSFSATYCAIMVRITKILNQYCACMFTSRKQRKANNHKMKNAE